MSDSLSEAAMAELPYDPMLGLHRRHQADPLLQHNNNNNNDDDDEYIFLGEREDNGDTENRDGDGHGDGDAPSNNDTEVRPPQESSNPANTINNNDNDNRNTTIIAPTPTPSSLSPFSGSIGIGVFRISRWYCLLSVLSALLAIVVAPIPTPKIEYHDWTTIMYRVAEGNSRTRNNPRISTMKMVKNSNSNSNGHYRENDDGGTRTQDINTNTNGGDNMNMNMNSILQAKPWSVEEIITHAAVVGVAASRQRGVESKVDSGDSANNNNNKDAGSEQRRRRRRPASSVEQQHSDIKEQNCSTETKFSAANENSPSSQSLPPTKANASAENKNGNGNVPASWLKYWIEQANTLAEETSAEITERRKKKLRMAAERKVWWAGWLENNKDTDEGHKGISGDSDDGKSQDRSREGKDDSSPIKHEKEENDEEWQWIDSVLLEYVSFSHIVTNIIDKILKSTIRLCVITNFMLAMTYLLHSAVAAWFLSHSGSSDDANTYANATRRRQETRIGEHPATFVTDWSFASSSAAAGARERMGGFLVFKLLLISAVVAPDTLDLLILLTWFTLLGCLRSLDDLAHSTNTHLTAMGQPPKKGVVQLLFWVLACDVLAAGSCVALFHTAGWGMVLLLTCDCALLGADAMSHILKYYQCVLEDSHDTAIRGLEARQLDLHRAIDNDNVANEQEEEDDDSVTELSGEGEGHLPTTSTMTPTEVQQESGRLDRQMEGLELIHNRRLSILDTAIFGLEMTCHMLTVAHFCHIWSLHGVQFTLIDGVLALHLHSAISTACAKLARRRNVHSIARDLQGHFPNATDEELKKASAAGDVCCICLGSMSTGGNVKKVHCGHIYHTHCLREVIERAQNLQAAKCPLCRAPLVDGCHPVTTSSPTNNNIDSQQRNIPVAPPVAAMQQENPIAATEVAAPIPNNGAAAVPIIGRDGEGGRDIAPIRQVGGERALFRFSTEGILPVWLPVPAFSFEVVRRPPQPQHEQIQPAAPILAQPIDQVAIPTSNQDELNPEFETDIQIHAPQLQQQQQHQHQETQVPFFQRLLMLAGVMPMSPEEEARALAQLVDMFPQYDRNDLSRELRVRGSLEAVTEAILMGIFSGVPRGD